MLTEGLLVIAAGGGLAFLLGVLRRDRPAILVQTLSVLAGSLMAGAPAWRVLVSGTPLATHQPWSIPLGSLSVLVDRLAAFFLLLVLTVASAAAIYGAGYVEHWRGRRPLGSLLLFFNLLVVSMVVVVIARNGVLFLFGWEGMALCAAALVAFEHERPDVRQAALTYLVMTHVAATFVIAFFLVLGRDASTLDFEALAAHAPGRGTLLSHALFVCALVGFGTKCGTWPLHIWLPQAHPVAPTHVSAVMSGVIIKTAVYALLRGLSLLGEPHPAWGFVVIGLGSVSAVLGILSALAQHDLKRLLAYSTIENAGVIAVGIGAGLVGLAYHRPAVAVLGFGGAILHSFNHALFKSLLFFAAGAVLTATHVRELDRLGGLAKRMPWTATTFAVAAWAVCGLPPLNGFVSEWLIYSGLFGIATSSGPGPALAAIGAIAALAIVGGLAAACFARAAGVGFLGSARSDEARHAGECRRPMRFVMVALAVACVVGGLGANLAGAVVLPVAGELAGVGAPAQTAAPTMARLASVTTGVGVFAAIALSLAALRWALLSGRSVELAETWGCGYGEPTPRLQYTASSFGDPLVRLARPLLGTEVRDRPPRGWFPVTGDAERATHTGDAIDDRVVRPTVQRVARGLYGFRWLQQGRLQFYVLYIVLTLVALLAWVMLGGRP